MKKALPISTLIVCFSFAQAQELAEPINTHHQIQYELNKAEADFETAQRMFLPWYTGPLIAGSAVNVPARKINIQGYFYSTWDYAEYNNRRKFIDIPTVYSINPLVLLQRGITDWLDFTFIGQWFGRWRKKEYSSHFGDSTIDFGFALLKQTKSRPAVRLVLGEVLPTGKYRHLDPIKGGIDSTGDGVFQTSIGLNLAKLFWQMKLHPVSLRFSTSYLIPNMKSKVRGFHTFGGGPGTRGKIKVGQTYNADVGVEVSLTQKWVFACDLAYTFSLKSTFSGNPGVGSGISNGVPFSDLLSLAPAIEYNHSGKGGFIGGIWLSLTGKNSSSFVSLILSYTQLF